MLVKFSRRTKRGRANNSWYPGLHKKHWQVQGSVASNLWSQMEQVFLFFVVFVLRNNQALSRNHTELLDY